MQHIVIQTDYKGYCGCLNKSIISYQIISQGYWLTLHTYLRKILSWLPLEALKIT